MQPSSNVQTIETVDVEGRAITVPLSHEFVGKVLWHLRATGKADKRWDVNFTEGQHGEEFVLSVLKDKSMEEQCAYDEIEKKRGGRRLLYG